jgi:hypothetical protein
MTEKERSALICQDVGTSTAAIPGSVILACVRCEKPIWAAPSGQQLMAEKGAEPLCLGCGRAAIAADPAPEISPLTEAQKDEIRKVLSDEIRKVSDDA